MTRITIIVILSEMMKVILSMADKLEEKEIFWSRYNGGWMKKVTGLNKAKKDGWSLLGDFVDAGRTKNDYKEGLYINCNIDGSRKNQKRIVQLLKLDENGNIELLKELENGGRTWAVEFWELIEENLEEEVKKSADEILADIKSNLTPTQIQELLKKLQPNSKLKVGVHNFCKVERIDKELNETIKELEPILNKKGGFGKLSYEEKSEVFGLAILKNLDYLQYFEDDEIDRVFIPKGENMGKYSDYTLFISDEVDGFAKTSLNSNGRWSIKLRLLY